MIEKTKAYTYKGVPYSTKELAVEAYARDLLLDVFPMRSAAHGYTVFYSYNDIAKKLDRIQNVINKVQAMRDSII